MFDLIIFWSGNSLKRCSEALIYSLIYPKRFSSAYFKWKAAFCCKLLHTLIDVRLCLEPWLQGYRRGFEPASFSFSSSSSSSSPSCWETPLFSSTSQLSSPSRTKIILDLSRVSNCVEEHWPFFLALPPVEKGHDCSRSSGETRQKTQLRKHGTHRASRDSEQERKWGGATLSRNSAHNRVLVPFIYPLIWLSKIKMFAYY